MTLFTLTHPTATLSRCIENTVIYGDQSNLLVKGICGLSASIVSSVALPIFLTLELIFKQIPKMLKAIGTEKFQKKADKSLKYFLSIIPSIFLGLYLPEVVPGFFLKRQKTDKDIRPFGVEKIFGKTIENGIDYPKTAKDVQRIINESRQQNQQVSIIGAGMSQGNQTVPTASHQRVVNTKYLNSIAVDADANTVTVGSGATWEKIQLELDKLNKSAIVKQASDIFSIGGSIGINCHGWAHKYGSISQTVRSLKIVDANGELRTLTPPRPGVLAKDLTDEETLFRCMFGTLGYFGVIIEATLDIVDNEELVELTEEVDLDQFTTVYEKIKQKDNISLFGGRLSLDQLGGDPFRKVYMVSYQKRENQTTLANRTITEEPKWGTRIQRISLKLITHLSNFSVKRLLSYFWKQEKKAIFSERIITRNQALHPPINAFKILHQSDLHTQWLQEYFIEKDKLANFLHFLGAELKANDVRLINATIRPCPKDEISILPYAEQDRYGVVICFAQKKTETEIAITRKWIENINAHLSSNGGVFYQAYMPYATVDQFKASYGTERIEEMQRLKNQFDPHHLFGNAHTEKYYDQQGEDNILPTPTSSFRTVFGTKDLQNEFIKFLKTIFYQLDEKKVLAKMDKILADPTKTDREIYEELVANIDEMKKRFPTLFYQLKALSVLQKGMGLQAAQLMTNFRNDKFHHYLEIYFRRYLKTIQKTAKLPLDGKIFDLSDKPYDGSLKEKIEAGALLSSYPYQSYVSLNDDDCVNPGSQPEKTHKPIGDEVQDGDIDLINCLGGLHHIPQERRGAFVDSIFNKLKPGGVVLLRDHDVNTPERDAIVSVVHSFVNAVNGASWDVENREIREFQSVEYWDQFMQAHHFTRISPDALVLENDPTQNSMMAFVRTPNNLKELQLAARYRADGLRSPDSTRATWIEWGNVRYSKQYAEFIQNHHAYAFDYIGHLRQHLSYFTSYIKESKKDLHLKTIIFSENFMMNCFILISTTFQCLSGYLGSLPSQVIARLQHGVDWRNATDLTAFEKYEATVEKEYSESLNHTPFYMFPYLNKIQGLWSAIWSSDEHKCTKFTSSIHAVSSTIQLFLKAAVSVPFRYMYTQGGKYIEPDAVSILIHDPKNQFQTGEKAIDGKMHSIKVVYETPDGHKLVLVPRYRIFTELCKELAVSENVQLIEIGGQPTITVDVFHKQDERGAHQSSAGGSQLLYEMDKLQDPEKRRYATYQVNVADLINFEKQVGTQRIEYVHE